MNNRHDLLTYKQILDLNLPDKPNSPLTLVQIAARDGLLQAMLTLINSGEPLADSVNLASESRHELIKKTLIFCDPKTIPDLSHDTELLLALLFYTRRKKLNVVYEKLKNYSLRYIKSFSQQSKLTHEDLFNLTEPKEEKNDASEQVIFDSYDIKQYQKIYLSQFTQEKFLQLMNNAAKRAHHSGLLVFLLINNSRDVEPYQYLTEAADLSANALDFFINYTQGLPHFIMSRHVKPIPHPYLTSNERKILRICPLTKKQKNELLAKVLNDRKSLYPVILHVWQEALELTEKVDIVIGVPAPLHVEQKDDDLKEHSLLDIGSGPLNVVFNFLTPRDQRQVELTQNRNLHRVLRDPQYINERKKIRKLGEKIDIEAEKIETLIAERGKVKDQLILIDKFCLAFENEYKKKNIFSNRCVQASLCGDSVEYLLLSLILLAMLGTGLLGRLFH